MPKNGHGFRARSLTRCVYIAFQYINADWLVADTPSAVRSRARIPCSKTGTESEHKNRFCDKKRARNPYKKRPRAVPITPAVLCGGIASRHHAAPTQPVHIPSSPPSVVSGKCRPRSASGRAFRLYVRGPSSASVCDCVVGVRGRDGCVCSQTDQPSGTSPAHTASSPGKPESKHVFGAGRQPNVYKGPRGDVVVVANPTA